MSHTDLHQTASTTGSTSLSSLASQTKADRNRAVDFFRVIAMVAVAVGHWLAMVAMIDEAGDIVAGNALEFIPTLSWATWLLQVMPLFFVVGGFSSAMSLDAHNRAGGRPQDWIAARLRRMMPPAVVLASTWLVVIVAGAAVGHAGIAIAAAGAAAIPLWFLANYTIDTALAPFVLPRFRANPKRFAVILLGAFTTFEVLRIADVRVLPHFNWVLGWLAFQMLGMAWRDGLLPSGRRLLMISGALFAATLTLVLTGGPWSISMVNFGGMENSPTNPPTLTLLLFGGAYSLVAIAIAPRLSDFLAARPRLWTGVIAANTVAMSVYLWHMTAAMLFFIAVHLTVGLPTAAVGTAAFWAWKIPMLLGSAVVLASIVALVARFERRALLAPRRAWNGGLPAIIAVAALTSAALKAWTLGQPLLIVGGCTIVVALGHSVFRRTPSHTRMK